VPKPKARRQQPAPRPRAPGEWLIVLATNAAAKSWEELCRQAPGNVAKMWDALTADPRQADNPNRQHRLKGGLSAGVIGGRTLDQWQYEVTGGGRVRYCIDDADRSVWIVDAGTGHPKDTE
jgi:hypothetical protein